MPAAGVKALFACGEGVRGRASPLLLCVGDELPLLVGAVVGRVLNEAGGGGGRGPVHIEHLPAIAVGELVVAAGIGRE